MNNAKKVVVGMSGGVDSSVAAHILKEQGYDVIGITMQVWQDEDRDDMENHAGCCGLSAVEDAKRVSEALGIPHYTLNFKKVFREKVIDYFVNSYISGKTPNPCIACNRYVKWESLLQKSLAIGAESIATGHYARIFPHPRTGRLALKQAATLEKDQTYALYSLTQEQLRRTLLPIGGYTKEQVRGIASRIGLTVANKPDSQEICFVPDDDYGNFVLQNAGKDIQSGDFVDVCGNVLGRHRGIIHYTVGQRKGLGISLGKRIYVKYIDAEKNQVVLADDNEVFDRELYVVNLNLMSIEDIPDEMVLNAKIRYGHRSARCTVKMDGNRLRCVFDEPQRAITPGQAAVFYDEDGYVVCGGEISL